MHLINNMYNLTTYNYDSGCGKLLNVNKELGLCGHDYNCCKNLLKDVNYTEGHCINNKIKICDELINIPGYILLSLEFIALFIIFLFIIFIIYSYKKK